MKTAPTYRDQLRRASGGLAVAIALLLSPTAFADEDPPTPDAAADEATDESAAETTTDASDETGPAALDFFDDMEAASAEALERRLPMLILALPDWYESPEAAQLHGTILTSTAAREKLQGFVRVLVKESPDREVHVRHRVKARGYPLAVVLSADGGYVGSHAGLTTGDDAAAKWSRAVAAIPARHARMKKLRAQLAQSGEDPVVLLALARLHLESGEPERADALLARADPEGGDDAAGVLGEVRYLRLSIANDGHLTARRFTDVEPLCNRWLRRFRKHARRPDVLLLRANALYLSGKKDEARTRWKALVKEHAKAPAAKRAKAALKELGKD